jgi:hypothetical protein
VIFRKPVFEITQPDTVPVQKQVRWVESCHHTKLPASAHPDCMRYDRLISMPPLRLNLGVVT